MRKLQKPPVREAKTSKKEPLVEGLQITVPIGPMGVRLWRKLSSEKIVEFSRKVMRENGITSKEELKKVDSGLHHALRLRGLLDQAGFEEKRRKKRSWKGLSDEDVVELARKVMEENKITGSKELESADSRLYDILRKRSLLERINFEVKHISWRDMDNEQIVDLARKTMEEKGIIGRRAFSVECPRLYAILGRRGLLEEVGFVEQQRSWSDMSDIEIVEFARKVIEEKEISLKAELRKCDSGLYQALRRRGIIDEVGFEDKKRYWKKMSNEEIVEFARKLIREKKMAARSDLKKLDYGLYQALGKRRLLDRAFAQMEQQKENRARQDVIDALEAFGTANDNAISEDEVA